MTMINVFTRFALVIVLEASVAVALRAQTGSGPQGVPAQGPQGEEVVLVGCLVRIDTSARRPGTTGSTPPGKSVRAAASGFALKDAAVAKEGATGPVATKSEQEVAIAKSDKVDLAAHVNRQVEVKGRLGGQASDGRGGPAGASATAAGGQSGSSSPTARDADFHVTSIRTISDTCP
jgi:hypothetical protein